MRRVTPDGKVQTCRPYPYDSIRCYRVHAEDDPLLGQPIEPSKRIRQTPKTKPSKPPLNPGLEPKTVVNTHRMLHRAWEDFEVWGWAKRNVVADAHPPRVPRKGRKVWTVGQLQTFLQRSRQIGSSRCGCSKRPPVCGAASWRAHAATCSTSTPEHWQSRHDAGRRRRQGDRVGRQDGERAAPPSARPVHPRRSQGPRRACSTRSARTSGRTTTTTASCSAGRTASLRTPTRSPADSSGSPRHADLPEIDLHDVRHSYATAGRNAKIDWKALSKRIGHCRRRVHDEAVRADRPRSRPRGCEHARRADHRRPARLDRGTHGRRLRRDDEAGTTRRTRPRDLGSSR